MLAAKTHELLPFLLWHFGPARIAIALQPAGNGPEVCGSGGGLVAVAKAWSD